MQYSLVKIYHIIPVLPRKFPPISNSRRAVKTSWDEPRDEREGKPESRERRDMADGDRKSSQNLGQLEKTEITWALQELRSSRWCTQPEIVKKG